MQLLALTLLLSLFSMLFPTLLGFLQSSFRLEAMFTQARSLIFPGRVLCHIYVFFEVPCMSCVPVIQLCLVMLGFSVSPTNLSAPGGKKVAPYPNLCTHRLAQGLIQSKNSKSIHWMRERHKSERLKSYYISKQVRTRGFPAHLLLFCRLRPFCYIMKNLLICWQMAKKMNYFDKEH